MRNDTVPITKLSEKSIQEVKNGKPGEVPCAKSRCLVCGIKACDYCEHALRTGKRRAK